MMIPHMLVLLIISLLNKVNGTNTPEDDEILFKFADDKTLSIKKTDIKYENFEYIYSKIERWNSNQKIEMTNMTIDLFNLIIDVYQKNGFVVLSDDDFADFITGVDFLGIREYDDSNQNELIQKSSSLSVLDIVHEVNILLMHENLESEEFFKLLDKKILEISSIRSLGFRNALLLKLFEKYLESTEKDSKVEFSNGLLRCYIKKVEPDTVPTSIDIKYYYKGLFCYQDLALDKLFTWTAKALNLSRLMFTSNNRNITILFFDHIKNKQVKTEKSCLSETLDIIKDEFNPVYLNLVNVISHEDDFIMFEPFTELKTLKVQNSRLIEMKFSDFKIESLRYLLLVRLKLNMREFVASSIFNNLNSFKCFCSEFFGNKNDKMIFNKLININRMYLQECKLDKIFFDWFHRITEIEKLEFYNNLSTCSEESEINLNNRILYFKDPCFTEEQLKILIEKTTLNSIEMKCKKHGFEMSCDKSDSH